MHVDDSQRPLAEQLSPEQHSPLVEHAAPEATHADWQAPAEHVWPAAVQSLHASPPLPHALSSPLESHTPEEQQPEQVPGPQTAGGAKEKHADAAMPHTAMARARPMCA